ncbi:MAG: hypothetical protein QOE97_2723 [Pseudonocardiales bacterium]|nr:hypothetical protein [Pseudonocardiales bacterium]
MPKSSVESVEVIDNPHADLIPREIDLGFAGNTAPGRKIMTVKTRAKRLDGARAALVVYANRSAVVIRLAANETPWRLIIVSNKNAGSVAGSVGESVGL